MPLAVDTYIARTEAALNSGTLEQRVEKLIAFVALNWGDQTLQQRAKLAERIERLVHVERPEADPR